MALRWPAGVTDSRSNPGQSPSPAPARQFGSGDVVDRGARRLLVRLRNPHGDFLYTLVVSPALVGVTGRQHQGVCDDLGFTGVDQGRLQLQQPQAAVLVVGEAALLVLDPGKIGGSARIAFPRQAADALPPGQQLGLVVIAAAADPLDTLRQ